MRIGVFGGSFDPVHCAHLIVAEVVANEVGLDLVRFVPAATQPFKPEGHHAGAAHRVEMLRLALQDHPRFLIDLREVERGGISYTVDTLLDLSREFPSDELFLMIGADVARNLRHWRDADKLGELARIVAMSRAGASAAPDSTGITRTITVPSMDVSATTVREAVRNEAPVTGMVPDSVADYIRTHQLYHSGE